MTVLYLQLFWVFFKQGLLGFGGGYAMLSLMQHDVVERYAWLDPQGFSDIVALSQTTPGPICINAATYVGYHASFALGQNVFLGVLGSLTASLAVCLPSVFLVWVGLSFLLRHRGNAVVGSVIQGFKLVSVALIASVAIGMMNPYNFADYKSLLIFVIVFAASFRKNFHPLLCILLCALLGFFLYGGC